MKMKNIYVDMSLKFKLKNKFNNMYMFINLRIILTSVHGTLHQTKLKAFFNL